jgi:hypothetical protein
MPIGRYIAWAGALLLVLLFVADWYLPKYSSEPPGDPIEKPVIRIASVQQPPERVVIDTTQPIIVTAAAPDEPTITSEPSPVNSYASGPSLPPMAPLPIVVEVDKKRTKVTQRKGPKIAANQPPSKPTLVPAIASAATTVPKTRLSFEDIISGQLVRNLFNLH